MTVNIFYYFHVVTQGEAHRKWEEALVRQTFESGMPFYRTTRIFKNPYDKFK